jgi:hypothetical protein
MKNEILKKFIDEYIDDVAEGSVIVEIGSDRYEGSTNELDQLAQKYNIKLISVDIFDHAKNRIGNTTTNTEFVVETGSTWAKSYNGPPISVLMLDNFDYNWDVTDTPDWIQNQIKDYRQAGIEMTNFNCQIEHMSQLIHLYPHLTPDATVMFDDTYTRNDCWVGKCGPGVVFLQAQGWKIIEHNDYSAVILQR